MMEQVLTLKILKTNKLLIKSNNKELKIENVSKEYFYGISLYTI